MGRALNVLVWKAPHHSDDDFLVGHDLDRDFEEVDHHEGEIEGE